MTELRPVYDVTARKPRRLTTRQSALLRYIIAYKEASGGDSPTRREMRRAVGYSSLSTVNHALGSLARRGLISCAGGAKSRSIAVTGGRWVYEPVEDNQQ